MEIFIFMERMEFLEIFTFLEREALIDLTKPCKQTLRRKYLHCNDL